MVKEKKRLRLKDTPQKIKDLAALISAAIIIGGALIGCGKWLLTEINASTNARVDALEKKIDDNHANEKAATTRLELMVLIDNDPDNIIEIEKLAKYYFNDLNGNSYMTSMFSKWCKEHNANCEIVLK